MAVAHSALLSLLLTALTLTSYHQYGSRERATSSVSEGRGDGNLTVYAMAVGQGDGNIILCPNGRDLIIVDMGAKGSQFTNRVYGAYLLKEKFKVVKNQMKIHIVITHPDDDHFNFLPFSIDSQILPLVSEIVMGGNFEEYPKSFKNWMDNTSVPVYTVNNGSECFGNKDCSWTPNSFSALYNDVVRMESTSSDRWQFCGSDVNVTVLGANICAFNKQELKKNNYVCTKAVATNKNARSIVMKLTYKDWSILLSGDFEGVDQQKKLIDHWSTKLQSTYFKVAHHGAWTEKKANSFELLNVVRPKRVYLSQAHPIMTLCFNFMHPRCEVIFNLLMVDSIEMVDSSARNSSMIVCYEDWGGEEGDILEVFGYSMYETCREYDVGSDKQICRDIVITSDGRDDHTVYVDVPDNYVHRSTSRPTPNSDCSKRKEGLKHRLSRLP